MSEETARYTLETPGRAVIRSATRPPVQLSAVARVRSRSFSRWKQTSARSFTSTPYTTSPRVERTSATTGASMASASAWLAALAVARSRTSQGLA